jgi:alpha-tubulin suppressor-like RCC1 family protein
MSTKSNAIILSFLMITLSVIAATPSLTQDVLDEPTNSSEVIRHSGLWDEPGFQEGSIFTDTTISSGGDHTCAILDNGSVMCWGYGASGQLGNGGTGDFATPTLTSSLGVGRTAVAISSGQAHTCAILDNGNVSCWGEGVGGQLGNGGTLDKTTPTLTSSLGPGRTAVEISSGGYHTCAILDNGEVSCWGWNDYGQLGNGGTSQRNIPTLTSSLGVGRTAVAISSGQAHTCAILDNEEVMCWGYGAYGQLGNGGTSQRNIPTLTSSLGVGRTAVAISSARGDHTCAILDNGSVSCWGYGSIGRLGNGGTSQQNSPTLTSSLGVGRTAVAISSGGDHTCTILDNEEVSCWGRGSYGQLGNGGTGDFATPTLTSSLGTGQHAAALSSGELHTCAILDNGSVSCWGQGGSGRLGNGGTSQQNSPTLTSSLGTGHSIALSERDFDGDGILNIFDTHQALDIREKTINSGQSHTCVLLDNGSVSCWGWNNYGQLGDGGNTDNTTPILTSSLGPGRTAVAVSTGGYHTCAILDNGSVSCWGRGGDGALGNGGNTDKNTSTPTSSLGLGRTAVAISSGEYHTCAILDNGAVSCWGRGGFGQLGNGGNTSNNNTTPTSSLGVGRTAVAISSGGYHTCALLDNGSVSCWGQGGSGQLGNGGNSDKSTPTLTSSLGTGRVAVAISSGGSHTCALLDNGEVFCWGLGGSGQLGNGGTSNQNSPSLTSSLGVGRTAVAISTGGYHTCAILDSGNVSCWGWNSYGQLGNGGTSQRNIPTIASSLGRVAVAVSLGGIHSCAVLDNGSVSCWGLGDDGALGNGGTSDNNTPTPTSSLGVGRTAALVDGDTDGDGMFEHLDDYPGNSQKSINCPLGTYGRFFCTDADEGHYVSQTGQTIQTACAEGTFQSAFGKSSCDDADAGYFVAEAGQSSQTACEPGTYQPATGQTTCDDADAGYHVAAAGQSSQTACEPGTYQPATGQASCDDADAGYFVAEAGQSNQTACGPGTYQAVTGQASCDDADAGYFVAEAGQSSQIACEPGTYQPATGQTTCDDADAGYHVTATGQSNQTACAEGTYQPATGQTSCDDADSGYHVAAAGQSNQTACEPGTYQPTTGQASCDDADAGYHVATAGQSGQITCGPGTYQSATGQTSCDDADAGYHVTATGQSNQTACAEGTYQPATGQTSCDDADAGNFVAEAGQSNQTACEPGTYQPATGQTTCDIADIGFYVSQPGSSSQDACPEKTSTLANSSVNEIQCLLDTDSDMIPDSLDTDDDNDQLIDSDDNCPEGELSWNSSAATDHDGDGCKDQSLEDGDDDNDGILDDVDACPTGQIGPWISSVNDYDNDGCVDQEDQDDDNDGVLDDDDACPLGKLDWLASSNTDNDADGCNDELEDLDDDGNGVVDASQLMLSGEGAVYTWTRIGIVLALLVITVIVVLRKKQKQNEPETKEYTSIEGSTSELSTPQPVETQQQMPQEDGNTEQVESTPNVSQQWTDEQGNTWRILSDDSNQWWNGTDWQDV